MSVQKDRFSAGIAVDDFALKIGRSENREPAPLLAFRPFGRRNITRFLGNVYCACARTLLYDFFAVGFHAIFMVGINSISYL